MNNKDNQRIAILASMKEEISLLLSYVKIHSEKIELNSSTWKGELFKKKVIVKLTGIGKVNAAMSTQHLISNHKISCIYNIGIAGGISKKVNIGDVICVDKAIQSDFDLTIFGLKQGQIPKIKKYYFPTSFKKETLNSLQSKYPIKFGNIISADQFIGDRKEVVNLGKKFNALAKDMETAAIAHVCYVNKIPFIAIRGISDNSGKFAIDEYKEFLKLAASNSTKVLLKIIKNQTIKKR